MNGVFSINKIGVSPPERMSTASVIASLFSGEDLSAIMVLPVRKDAMVTPPKQGWTPAAITENEWRCWKIPRPTATHSPWERRKILCVVVQDKVTVIFIISNTKRTCNYQDSVTYQTTWAASLKKLLGKSRIHHFPYPHAFKKGNRIFNDGEAAIKNSHFP